jgi:putative ABC transport system permease protein
MFLAVRTASDPGALAGSIVREIHAADPNIAVYQIRTMRDRLYDSLAGQRFGAAMLGAFALFSLVLASIGVYGVMAYLVSQSTHDIGVRAAFGVQRGAIIGMVVRQGIEMAALGIAVGLVGAAAVTRLMASLLFGVGASDAVTFRCGRGAGRSRDGNDVHAGAAGDEGRPDRCAAGGVTLRRCGPSQAS